MYIRKAWRRDDRLIVFRDDGDPGMGLHYLNGSPEYAEAEVILVDHPELLEAEPDWTPSAEEAAAQARAARDRSLEAVRWRLERNTDERELGLTETDARSSILEYKQALRDWPEAKGFPDLATMPAPADYGL